MLWSIGVLIVSLALVLFASRTMVYEAFGKHGDLGILIEMQFEEAKRVYLTEGKDGLAAYMQVLNSSYPGDHYYMVDASGHDVITGEDRSKLAAMVNSRLDFLNLNAPPVVAVPATQSPYKLVLITRYRSTVIRYLPYYVILICAVAILCWVMAFQFASPLKLLTETVGRFGAGELGVRARLARGDEIGTLGRAFDQMANRIESLLTAERRLLQDISHELRSPLTRLTVALKLTETSSDRDAARRQINKDVERIVGLIDSLIQLTRAEGEASTYEMESVALDQLVRELIEACGIEAAEKGSQLLLKGSARLNLYANRELLRRAIENVFRNAVRHAPKGTTIEVTLKKSAESASISIRDYGTGVPTKDLANIFKPFFRIDESRDPMTGGIGLGLAIAQRAVRLHNGQIWAENADPGLRVCLDLPLEGPGQVAAARSSRDPLTAGYATRSIGPVTRS